MTTGISDAGVPLRHRPRAPGKMQLARKLPLPVVIFVIGLVIPLIFNLGSLRLSVYRIVLLALFLPSLYILLSGKAGRLRIPDICVIMICLWSALSFSVVHGFFQMIEPIGILIVETMGAYMLGRCFIRTPEAFHGMVRLLFWLGMLLLPFAIYETLTGQNITLQTFDVIGSAYPDVYKEPRWGLDRVQGPFEHPILFGVFFGSLTGLVFYVLGFAHSLAARAGKTTLIMIIGTLALSSGPLSALVAQVFFIFWDRTLQNVRSRWYILSGLSVLAYIVIDVQSNRNPFQVFVSYLSFNPVTAYNRIFIWEWGTKSIFSHPLFGIGFNDWERMWWMTGSVDMFWILPAMQHGIPVWILFFALFFSIFFSIAGLKFITPKLIWYRLGFLTTLFGLFMAGWTVHYWNATFALFMFLLGSGVWMLDWKETEPSKKPASPEHTDEKATPYSRFPNRGSLPSKPSC